MLFKKHIISKTKTLNMVGMLHSSHYRTPSLAKKGNKPSELILHKYLRLVDQNAIIGSIKEIFSHEFIDFG